jgi:phage terminase small subunit
MPAGQPITRTAKRRKGTNPGASRGAAARKAPNTSSMAGAAAVDPNKPLTEKQKLFAKNIASGDSVPNAMARAGYSTADYSLGSRMMVMPNIKAVIDAERKAFEEANQMTRKKVMEMLQESYDMAKLAAEPATMVSAAREIGKMCGYYEPRKVQVDVNLQGSIAMGRMNALSDADLLKIIESGGATTLLEAPETGLGDDSDED